jgi:hypothetical protein
MSTEMGRPAPGPSREGAAALPVTPPTGSGKAGAWKRGRAANPHLPSMVRRRPWPVSTGTAAAPGPARPPTAAEQPDPQNREPYMPYRGMAMAVMVSKSA